MEYYSVQARILQIARLHCYAIRLREDIGYRDVVFYDDMHQRSEHILKMRVPEK